MAKRRKTISLKQDQYNLVPRAGGGPIVPRAGGGPILPRFAGGGWRRIHRGETGGRHGMAS